jgi:hypothetical protein
MRIDWRKLTMNYEDSRVEDEVNAVITAVEQETRRPKKLPAFEGLNTNE